MSRSGVFLNFGMIRPIALPGIFAQLFDALRHFHRAAELDGLEARLIHLFGDRHHHAGAHVVSPQALLAVAQGRVDKTNFSHRLSYSVKRIVVKPIGSRLSYTRPGFPDFRARGNSAGTEKLTIILARFAN